MKIDIHIGLLIQNTMKEQERTASWLAKKLNCNRSNIYKIYEKSNIDMILLFRISNILNYDFFSDISVIFNNTK